MGCSAEECHGVANMPVDLDATPVCGCALVELCGACTARFGDPSLPQLLCTRGTGRHAGVGRPDLSTAEKPRTGEILSVNADAVLE
eukprot:146697-Amphidinium_carterae.1